MQTAVERLWYLLADMNPEDVCRRSYAIYDDKKGLYQIMSFGWKISLSPEERKISGSGSASDILLKRMQYFSELSILSYLTSAKDIPLTNNLVSPMNLRGGQLFFRGTHVLPLDTLSRKYGGNTGDFLAKGRELGGEPQEYGDASVRLFPLPRVPVILVLWEADSEFPAEAKILFDSSCEFHIPIDIIWSVGMMSLLIMM